MNYTKSTIELIENKYSMAKTRKEEELEFICRWSSDMQKKICVFGAGSGGGAVYATYSKLGIKIDYYCDNDSKKWGTNCWGEIKCISPMQLLKYGNDVLVIIAAGGAVLEDIYMQVREMGICNIVKHCESQLFLELSKEKSDFDLAAQEVSAKVTQLMEILDDEESKKVLYYKFRYLTAGREEMNDINFGDIFSDNQYFIDNGRYLKPGEIIVDCGAFDGDTLRFLLEQINFSTFIRYICYELDPDTFTELKSRVSKLPEEIRNKVVLRPYGVADGNKDIVLCEEPLKMGKVVSLDEVEKECPITFLKMDIEGSEMESLYGASKIIRRNQPQCAICVYHNISDMWKIPLLLHEMLPDHKLILRHHQYSYSETVCYALRRDR